MPASKPRQLKADLLLLLVTIIWGGTFVMVKDAIASYPIFSFLALRFALAALLLLPFAWRRFKGLGWRGVGAGVLIGLLLFAGYAFQTFGLRYTTASKVGLITGLSVVLVPLLSAAVLRRTPGIAASLGVLLATIGLIMLTFDGNLAVQRGDLLAALCALSFALHIVAVAAFAPKADPIGLTFIQVATVMVVSGVTALATEPAVTLPAGNTWFAAIFTGVLATAVAFGLQTSMQRFTTPTHTALIFAAEPVFAALFGVLLAGDVLPARGIVGGVLIILGAVSSEVPWSERTARLISRFLAPQYVMSALLLLLALYTKGSVWRGLLWGALVGVLSVGIPLLFFWRQLRHGNISDWHVSKREERLQPTLVISSILAPLIPIAVIYVFRGPLPLLVGLMSALMVILVNLLVTFKWKISQHTSAMAASATLAAALLGVAAWPSLLLVPLVAWARVKVGAHTVLQTIAGGTVGFAVTLIAARVGGLL
jgi:drug/metabolite transporter (DMT)-like permease